MKLIALIILMILSFSSYATEILITSHQNGQVYQDGNGRINLSGKIVYNTGENTNNYLGPVTCNGVQAQVQGGSYQWTMYYFEIFPGNNQINCSYTRNGVTVTKSIILNWEITAEVFIDSPVNGYKFRDQQGRFNLTGHISFKNPQDVTGNLGQVKCNNSYAQVQGGGFQWRVDSYLLPGEGSNTINCTYTWNGKTTTKAITIFWSKTNFPPTASFSLSPETGDAPLNVAMDATASSDPDGQIVLYSWNFGDGSIGTGANLSHTFSNPGNYSISLTVKDNENATKTLTKTIVVKSPKVIPVANVSAQPISGNIPLSVTFDASLSMDPDGGMIKEYHFDFGNGESSVSTIPFLTHVFESEGSFDVTVQVKDDEDSLSEAVHIPIQSFRPNIPPVAIAHSDKTSGYPPLSVHFDGRDSYDTDGNIQNYIWTFPGGVTKSGREVDFSFTSSGIQIVTLVVTDDRNVPSEASITIDVGNDSTPPSISVFPISGSTIKTPYPAIEFSYQDANSGVNLSAVRAFLNGVNITDRLHGGPTQAIISFTIDYPLTAGQHDLVFEVEDQAGNVGTVAAHYFVDLGDLPTYYISGTLQDEAGAGLPGVSVQDVHAPPLKKVAVLTDSKGRFQIPYNQTGNYRFNFAKSGYMTSVRSIDVTDVYDVDMGFIVLGEKDSVITPIVSSIGGVAHNSTGTLTYSFPPNALPFDLNVQMTEYTNPDTMPGPLPEMSAFTYAFNMSEQNFPAPESSGITFTLQNTLNFPQGTPIVYGIFDASVGRWLDSGKTTVVGDTKVLAGGIPIPPDPQLGDPNIPNLCGPGGCTPPDLTVPQKPKCPQVSSTPAPSVSSSGTTKGCVIGLQDGDLSVEHNLPSFIVNGTSDPLRLVYHSSQVKPYFIINTNLTSRNPDPADGMEVELKVANKTIKKKYGPEATAGKTVLKEVVPAINEGGTYYDSGYFMYSYDISLKYSNSEYATASYFGGPPLVPTGVLSRVPVKISTKGFGFGNLVNRRKSVFGKGWGLSIYDKITTSRTGTTHTMLESGDGSANRFLLISPEDFEKQEFTHKKLSFTPHYDRVFAIQGSFFATDCQNSSVYRISSNGNMEVVAGSGQSGFSGDNGSATKAKLNCPVHVAAAETGGFYIADKNNYRIRRVSKDGRISTIAHNPISAPTSVSEDKMRAVYFTTEDSVMLITPRGKLETYSSRDSGYVKASLSNPSQVIFDDYGYPIIVDKDNSRILKMFPQDRKLVHLLDSKILNKINFSDKKLKISQIVLDSVNKFYYLLSDKGRVFIWNGLSTQKIFEISFEGKKVHLGKNKSDSQKPESFAYSPELGLAYVKAGQIYTSNDFGRTISSDGGRDSGGYSMPPPIERTYYYISEDGSKTMISTTIDHRVSGYSVNSSSGTAEFNSNGRLDTKTDSFGNSSIFFYDDSYSDKVTKIFYPKSGITYNITYDQKGYLNSVTDSAGRQTSFVINEEGNLTDIVNADGSEKHFEYSDELLSAETNEDNLRKEFFYEEGFLVKELLPGNRSRNFKPISLSVLGLEADQDGIFPVLTDNSLSSEVDSLGGDCFGLSKFNTAGSLIKHTDCLGNSTVNNYDSNGNMIETYTQESRLTSYSYDENNNIATMVNGSGATRYLYDETNNISQITDDSGRKYELNGPRPTYIKDPLGNIILMQYSDGSFLKKITDPLGNITSFSKDGKNNIVAIIDPLSQSTIINRDSIGNVEEVIDPLGRSVSFQYDIFNRLISITDPLNLQTQLTYNQSGNIKSVLDSKGHRTQFEYDPTYFKISKILNHVGQEEHFSYDTNERMTLRKNHDGSTISYTYDSNSWLKTINNGTDITNFSRDKQGLPTLVSNSDSTLSLNYDQFGRLTNIHFTHNNSSIHYLYNNLGLRSEMNVRVGGNIASIIKYFYDERQLLSRIEGNLGSQSISWERSWDELGRPAFDILSNGNKVEYRYDNNGRLTYLSNDDKNEKPIARFEYTLNPSGTVIQSIKSFSRPELNYSVGTEVYNYTYDAADRLTSATNEKEFTYDDVGNHLHDGGVFNEINQISEDNEYIYTFTTNGNLSSKVSKSTNEKLVYSWNASSSLAKVTVFNPDASIANEIFYKYDGIGRRISKKPMERLSHLFTMVKI